MSKQKTKETLWVSSVSPEELDGQSYIPTSLKVNGDEVLFGNEAIAAGLAGRKTNNEFKVALGDVVPGGAVTNRELFTGDDGKQRTAYELSKIYFDSLLSKVESQYQRNPDTKKYPAKIIVAEPLSFQIASKNKNWLRYYRDNIKRILFAYEDVEFLPEPFAVYQYYRYGQKFPQLHESKKHIAFIVDFGGGTFDACVIESNNDGDVSQTGKHSKPLSADSIDVGGFVINREIAKYLIKISLGDSDRSKADKFIEQNGRVRKGILNEDSLSDAYKRFISMYEKLEALAETYKIGLSTKIADWGLEAECYEFVEVDIPKNALISNEWVRHEFRGHQLRKIFVHEIWNKKLKEKVKGVLKIAEQELKGKSISVTLISGGSSNLRWLNELLQKDFNSELHNAYPVKISHSFQEVVANGLAIECARRFYSNNSEFVAVTYNPLKLKLAPNGEYINDLYKYKSVEDKIDMSSAKHGDLLPSAQALAHFFDKEIHWQVKLKRTPSSYLEYFFIRPDEKESFYNNEETRVETKNKKQFDSKTRIGLTVREDGTAIPRFIYQIENTLGGTKENAVNGRPFHIDMTSDSASNNQKSFYIGFDFGTSNSSLCVLPHENIELIQQRQDDSSWRGLSEEASALPYPVAQSVKKFLSNHDNNKTAALAREAFEAALAILSYTALAELYSHKEVSGVLKNFQHRSAGPLFGLLQNCLNSLGRKAVCTISLLPIINDKDIKKEFENAITDFNDDKHQTLGSRQPNWPSHVELIIRYVSKMMEGKIFGYSLESDKDPFSGTITTTFKSAKDTPPFIDTHRFKGRIEISSLFAWIIDTDSGEALNLAPFIFWDKSSDNNTSPNCYLFNKKSDNDGYSVKFCNKDDTVEASSIDEGFHNFLVRAFSGELLPSRKVELDL